MGSIVSSVLRGASQGVGMGRVSLKASPAPPLSTVFICLRHCLASSLQREVASTAARRPAGVSAIHPCWASSAARTVCRQGGRAQGPTQHRLCGPAAHLCWDTEAVHRFRGGQRCSAGAQGQLEILEHMQSQEAGRSSQAPTGGPDIVETLLKMQSSPCQQVSHLFGHTTSYDDDCLLAPVL